MYSSEITQASNFVKGVDTAFLVILSISFFFLISLTILMIVFIYKYNRKRHPVAEQIEGNTKLEIVWVVVPLLITLLMFYYGWAGWKPMTQVPDDAMEITVYGRMWNFMFEYENGKMVDTLYLPINQPVKLNLVAMDVLHSLYIPAFRVKQDMVPGKKDNFMWFEPQREGTYELYCAEYCGLEHSYMYSFVKVMEDSAFQTWLADTTLVTEEVISPTATGRRIMQNIGCFACHSLDGSRLVGPTFQGLYGNERTVVTNGATRQVVADDEYIHQSIFEPNADIVQGFGRGLMLSYKGQLSEEDVDNIIEYLKTLE
jgi:cytochrome c oxidase subunit II